MAALIYTVSDGRQEKVCHSAEEAIAAVEQFYEPYGRIQGERWEDLKAKDRRYALGHGDLSGYARVLRSNLSVVTSETLPEVTVRVKEHTDGEVHFPNGSFERWADGYLLWVQIPTPWTTRQDFTTLSLQRHEITRSRTAGEDGEIPYANQSGALSLFRRTFTPGVGWELIELE